MRKFTALIAILFIIGWLTGCTPQTYQLIEEDGKYYAIVNIPEEDEDEIAADQVLGGYLIYESLGELRNDLLTGSFTEEELVELSKMANSEGRITLFDLDNMYEPILPEECSEYFILFIGHTYRVHFKLNDGKGNGVIETSSKAGFEHSLVEKNIAAPVITLPSDSANDIRDEIDIVHNELTTRYKWCHYTIHTEDRIIYVTEGYEDDYSMDYPSFVMLHYMEGESLYEVYINQLTERPDVEWFTSFGIKDYVVS